MNDEIRKQAEQIKREWDEMSKEHERISAVFGQLAKAAEDMHRAAIESISIKDAVDRIRLELLKDKEPGSYYHSWLCNIAMAFIDSWEGYSKQIEGMDATYTYRYEIANEAAITFLHLLCSPTNSNIESTKKNNCSSSSQSRANSCEAYAYRIPAQAPAYMCA